MAGSIYACLAQARSEVVPYYLGNGWRADTDADLALIFTNWFNDIHRTQNAADEAYAFTDLAAYADYKGCNLVPPTVAFPINTSPGSGLNVPGAGTSGITTKPTDQFGAAVAYMKANPLIMLAGLGLTALMFWRPGGIQFGGGE